MDEGEQIEQPESESRILFEGIRLDQDECSIPGVDCFQDHLVHGSVSRKCRNICQTFV